MSASPDRHVSPETLQEYLRAGARASIPIDGIPQGILTIDPANGILILGLEWDGEDPPRLDEYLHISTSVRFRDDRNWVTLTVDDPDLFKEAYPLLTSVADLVQLESFSFADALHASLASYHDLLAAIGRMSKREEVGLIGELLFLSYLVDTMGTEAVSAWRAASEEHDFGFEEDDIEVKTTTAESRRHWINGIDQLSPSPGRSLWLLSIQLTDAASGQGWRLPGLIRSLEERLRGESLQAFKTRVASLGYSGDRAQQSYRPMRLRALPVCFRVESGFPRISTEILAHGGAIVQRISDVSYSINLDAIVPDPVPPAVATGFISEVEM